MTFTSARSKRKDSTNSVSGICGLPHLAVDVDAGDGDGGDADADDDPHGCSNLLSKNMVVPSQESHGAALQMRSDPAHEQTQ